MHTQEGRFTAKGRFTAEVQKKVKEKVGSIDDKLQKEENNDKLQKGGGKEGGGKKGGVDVYLQMKMKCWWCVNDNLHKEKEGVDGGDNDGGGDDDDDDSNSININMEEGEGSEVQNEAAAAEGGVNDKLPAFAEHHQHHVGQLL